MNCKEYLKEIEKILKTGQATEHSYRGALTELLQSLMSGVQVTNEPKRQACGAPDYVVTRKKIPFGYLEAKKFEDDSLQATEKGAQMKRYLGSLENLILTDYLEFRLFRDGEKVMTVKLADYNEAKKKLTSSPKGESEFLELIRIFAIYQGQTIKTASSLAKLMAGKARLLKDVIFKAITNDSSNSSLEAQFQSFKQILIHDLDEETFADIYAQTIVYGMFAARLHDYTLEDFSRAEAAELLPKSNPFLRKQFQFIAGPELDERVVWIIDATADLFRCCDVREILAKTGSESQRTDPMVHFYETFLGEYDSALRKKRGVFYTPEPVVQFIVRAVDDILKNDFGLKKGLADNTKAKVKLKKEVLTKGKATKSQTKFITEEVEMHRVQILDPATGTGTFLSEVIHQIHSKFKNNQGQWSNYVEEHLIPRIHGFELMMAPYAMCHLKLALQLKETGYEPEQSPRLGVYLTNALEEAHPDSGTIFNSWLADEAHEANEVKENSPVMVVMGNPPYAVSSTNKGEWIQDLLKSYKKDLNERKINLDDDYIKFIRYAQHRIDQTGQGVVAMITNNSFIDGLTHRQMRKSLLESFDKIYIYDLHGSAMKNEVAPDGSADQNVFDIMQGVSISIFVKSSGSKERAKVHHFDSYGKRTLKYSVLREHTVLNTKWEMLTSEQPSFYFVPREAKYTEKYEQMVSTSDLFKISSTGVESQRDSVVIQFLEKDVESLLQDFKVLDENTLREKHKIRADSRDWTISNAKADLVLNVVSIKNLLYRPFDTRFVPYTGTLKGIMAYPRHSVMNHLGLETNYGLLLCRQQSLSGFKHVFITRHMADRNSTSIRTKESATLFPLYLYDETPEGQTTTDETPARRPNLDEKLVKKLAKKIKLTFTPEKETTKGTFAPVDILDYIYAVLHSPNYREKYKEFLKIDFPRIPWPDDAKEFFAFGKLGKQLRELHLMESDSLEEHDIGFNISGDNLVDGKPTFEGKKVKINETQYFENVPKVAWEFYIGGYQPAQKWLKDRKGRCLDYDDVEHYQKMIKALSLTDKLMKQIDKLKEF
ncbi:MAG: N-6 DNA methylase [SAR324 cluster bacterium]|nr:N-6 DNA methylase [SAR324 cluster bacterium]